MTPRQIVDALLPVLAARSRGEFLYCEEWGVLSHQSRADVAAIDDGYLHLVEVKSDSDTLARLPSQEETYSAVADRCSLVTGPRYFEKASKLVPPWWGLFIADAGVIECRRAPAPWNPEKKLTRAGELLWGDEAEELARKLGLRATGGRRAVTDRLVRRLGEHIGPCIVAALRERKRGLRSNVDGVDPRPLLFRPFNREATL